MCESKDFSTVKRAKKKMSVRNERKKSMKIIQQNSREVQKFVAEY